MKDSIIVPFDLNTARKIKSGEIEGSVLIGNIKTVKLSDFSPYDRNKGGIQELHHKIEPKTLQYWGEDSGILIGITPIYKRHLWSEEVNVINDKQ